MSYYIQSVEPEQASGKLKEVYDSYSAKLGFIPHIVQAQSLRPDLVECTGQFFQRLMLEPQELSVATKELLAAYVGKIESCDY